VQKRERRKEKQGMREEDRGDRGDIREGRK